jgi:hypothetical protein
MRALKVFVALVTLTAVTGRPVLAAFEPCCCSRKVEVSRPCCAAKQESNEDAGIPAHSCCATKTAVAVVEASGCCCVKPPPAVPVSRDQAAKTAEQAPTVPVLAAVDLAEAAPAAKLGAHSSQLRPVSGPPLLALYCIWRK